MPHKTRERIKTVTDTYVAYGPNGAILDGPYKWPGVVIEKMTDVVGHPYTSKGVSHLKGYGYGGPKALPRYQTPGNSHLAVIGSDLAVNYMIASIYGPFGYQPRLFEERLNFLDWGKLPSSSQFSVIQILAELDDTLAMFAARFWRSLSYGSWTWGVLPFISDVKALLQTIVNLGTRLSAVNFEQKHTVSLDYATSSLRWVGHATVYHSGVVDYDFANRALVLLDRIGLHTDLSVAWDLIPFSFVVDYILPVGDFLDSLKQGGWVKVVSFTGIRSIKLKATYYRKVYTDSNPWEESPYGYYSRGPVRTLLTTELPSNDWAIEFPSFMEMFNMFYLFISQLKR